MRKLLQLVAAIAALLVTEGLFRALAGPQSHDLAFLAAIGGALAGAAGKALGRAATWAGRQIGGKKSAPILQAAGGAAVGAYFGGGTMPVSLPQLPMIPQSPQGPIGRTISRILPGGMTGNEYLAIEGVERDKFGRPIAVYPMQVERWKAPSGYVIVRDPNNPDAEPVAMLKGAARAMGLWSSRPKPPVSGYDMRAITRAKAARGRVKKLAGAVGISCDKRGTTSRRRK